MENAVLPYAHPFFSATWSNNDDGMHWSIGPIRGATQKWTNGRIDGTLPPAIPLGTSFDFSRPLTDPQDVYVGMRRQGIPEICWTNNGFPLIDPNDVFALTSCCMRLAYARMIDLLYSYQKAQITEFWDAWIGTGYEIEYIPLSGPFPSAFILKTALFAIVVISGTANYEQAALQAFTGHVPPADVGGIHSLPIWSTVAQFFFTRMLAMGIPANLPIMLAGHSYGAAICSILAAKMRLAHDERLIGLITFGMPKPGDAEMIRILASTKQLHCLDDLDPIPFLPPNLDYGFWFSPLVSLAIRSAWGEWSAPAEFLIIFANGEQEFGAAPSLTYDFLFPIILAFLLGEEQPAFTAHPITEYIRRMKIECLGPCWPIPAIPWEILFREAPAAFGALGLVGNSSPLGELLGLVGNNFPAGNVLGLVGNNFPAGELLGRVGNNFPAGNVLGMETIPPDPGSTCETRITPTLDVPYDFTITEDQEIFFGIPASPLPAVYSVKLTLSESLSVSWSTTIVCPFVPTTGTIADPPDFCLDMDGALADGVILRIAWFGADTSVTLLWQSIPC